MAAARPENPDFWTAPEKDEAVEEGDEAAEEGDEESNEG